MVFSESEAMYSQKELKRDIKFKFLAEVLVGMGRMRSPAVLW